MLPTLIALAVLAVIAAAGLGWRLARRDKSSRETSPRSTSVTLDVRPEFPPSGLLLPEGVLRSSSQTSQAIWDALEEAAVPVAVEYYPVTATEIETFLTVPVNASAQQAVVDMVDAIKPKGPTLFRVVLPKGAELVKAVGTDGFRGFSRTDGKTAHAVLKPVAAGAAVAAGWPALAVAGTVFALDMVAQREQRANQRRIEAHQGRQDERYYVERIKDQRSADAQLSRVISLMLDGKNPHLELALKSADDEFHRAQQFLEKYCGAIDGLVDEDGKVDYRRLDEALGGRSKETDHFLRELHLARASMAIRRKALLADAASVALTDPSNPYAAMRKLLASQAAQLEEAGMSIAELTERLSQVELKGRWRDSDKSIARRQEQLRTQVSPPSVEGEIEIRYLVASSGEIVQVVSVEDVEQTAEALESVQPE